MSEFNKYMEENKFDQLSAEKQNELMDKFMLEWDKKHSGAIPDISVGMGKDELDAFDYMDMAQDAKTKKDTIKYLKKAKEMDPRLFDADFLLIRFQEKYYDDCLSKLADGLRNAKKTLESMELLTGEEYGEMWMYHELRPYMRYQLGYAAELAHGGHFTEAIKMYEEMLKANTNDNQGVRSQLMHLYAKLEMCEAALKLRSEFDNDNTAQMLLPLSILYYRKMDYDKAKEVLLEISHNNKDLGLFVKKMAKANDILQFWNIELNAGYQPNTIEDLIVAVQNNLYLYDDVPYYFEWAAKVLKESKKPRQKRTK